MKKIHAVMLLVGLLVALSSCKLADVVHILVIDGWWNIDYAKNACASATTQLASDKVLIDQVGCNKVTSCPELSKIAEVCLLDTSGGIRDYENNLMTEFASNPKCKSVHVIYYAGSDSGVNKEYLNVIDSPHHMFTVNFTPNESTQSWQMTSAPKLGSYTQGSGSIKEIADKVCPIVAGTGASLSN